MKKVKVDQDKFYKSLTTGNSSGEEWIVKAIQKKCEQPSTTKSTMRK